MVRPERFELPTYSSGGCRSIQTELRAQCGMASVHRGQGLPQLGDQHSTVNPQPSILNHRQRTLLPPVRWQNFLA
jgi:hypothetical protein